MFLVKHPHHTEKSLKLNGQHQYCFIVSKGSNKVEIKKKIAELYNVVVVAVNTLIYPKKRIKKYTRSKVVEGIRPGEKKAIVTLRKGDVIDMYGEDD